MARSNSLSPPVFLSFFTRDLTAFSLHFWSFSEVFVRLKRREVLSCPLFMVTMQQSRNKDTNLHAFLRSPAATWSTCSTCLPRQKFTARTFNRCCTHYGYDLVSNCTENVMKNYSTSAKKTATATSACDAVAQSDNEEVCRI